MARRVCRYAVWVLLVLVPLTCRSGAAVAADAPEPVLWVVAQSFQGDPQYDPRLDKPVKMWEAGIEVAAVFAEIEKQTGVKVVCVPADDENARIPMNVFLNPQKSPVLRDVLAQLSWALNCSFFVEREPGQQVYELQHSSAAQSAAARMEADAMEDVRAIKVAPKAILAKVEEYKEALALPRDELIAQYQGKDDHLLLTLLDPQRRAALEFLASNKGVTDFLATCDLPAMPGYTIAVGGNLPGPFADADYDLFSQALNVPKDAFLQRKQEVHWMASSDGGLLLFCEPLPSPQPLPPFSEFPQMRVLSPESSSPDVSPQDAVGLEELVQGQPYPAEEKARRVAEIAEQQAIARYTDEEHQAAAERPLTVAVVKLLAQTALDLESDAPFWKVQEATARATGVNVVAESLYRGVPSERKAVPAKPSGITALSAIERYTRTSLALTRLSRPSPNPAWEWRGAGTFLTFRSGDGDVWRAARWPQEAIDWIDSFVKPYVPKDAAQKKRPYTISMEAPLDAQAWIRKLAALSDLQIRFGGRETYGDPREPLPLLRQSLLPNQTGPLTNEVKFLGSLDDKQWALVTSDGITDTDLKLAQKDLLWKLTGEVQEGPRQHATRSAEIQLRGGNLPAKRGLYSPPLHPGFYDLWWQVKRTTEDGHLSGGNGGGGAILPTVVKATVQVPQQ